MKKTFLKVAAVLAFAAFALAGCNKKAEAGAAKVSGKAAPESDFEVELIENDTAVLITKYNGSAKKVIIPGTIQGYPVVEIGGGREGFEGNDKIETVVIPEGVTSVAGFSGCKNLKTVMLPQSLKSIGSNGFSGCEKLTSIALPDGLEKIDGMAFSTSGLTSIELPDSIEKIGECAFANTELTSIALPDSLSLIYTGAFKNCDNLSFKDIKLPSDLSKLTVFSFNRLKFPDGLIAPDDDPDFVYAISGTKLASEIKTDLSVQKAVKGVNESVNRRTR